VKRIGILYRPLSESTRDLAEKLEQFLSSRQIASWRCATCDEDEARSQLAGTDLILSVGGDGTIIRTVRIVTPSPIPILGINLGKLGFITEIGGNDVLRDLPDLLAGKGWIEERAMLEAQVDDSRLHALNDVVLRSAVVRLVNVQAQVDGTAIITYRADGMIVATATGSTAYSLACGGPILHPQSREMVLQPISCHLGLNHALVLPPQSTITLSIARGEQAVLSVDGQVELPLSDGHSVRVTLSPHIARFVRIHEPAHFYGSLWHKLGGRGSVASA
jgi:NAD+ kinase